MPQDRHNEQIVRPLDCTTWEPWSNRQKLSRQLTLGGSTFGEATPSDIARNTYACHIGRRRKQNIPNADIVNRERYQPATVVVEMDMEVTG